MKQVNVSLTYQETLFTRGQAGLSLMKEGHCSFDAITTSSTGGTLCKAINNKHVKTRRQDAKLKTVSVQQLAVWPMLPVLSTLWGCTCTPVCNVGQCSPCLCMASPTPGSEPAVQPSTTSAGASSGVSVWLLLLSENPKACGGWVGPTSMRVGSAHTTAGSGESTNCPFVLLEHAHCLSHKSPRGLVEPGRKRNTWFYLHDLPGFGPLSRECSV